MKISVVTISFNQVKFLRNCIDSVLGQNYNNLEYIIVDPGSSDGSREIIDSYGDRVVRVYESDIGPADGLNKGFSRATGDILCYLNSDDIFLPDAFQKVVEFFIKNKESNVVCGHGYIIDEASNCKRRIFSDSFSLKAVAYGACVAIQPSTFFKREVFLSTSGFNILNRSNWDGELLIDMALAGSRITRFDEFLSCYRVHNQSITGSGKLLNLHADHSKKMFEKIMHRPYKNQDRFLAYFYRVIKHLKDPGAAFERIIHGPIFGTYK